MKITCQSCQAKYTIADEKVVGKTVKIKCKKCGAAIVVQGGGDPSQVGGNDAGYAPPEGDDGAETRVFGEQSGAGPQASVDAWMVNVSEGDERTMTSAQLAAEYARGALNNDTYVWREGMSDWLPIASVPELAQYVAAQGPGRAGPAAAAGAKPMGAVARDSAPQHSPSQAGAPRPLSSPPAAAAAPAAARRANTRGGVDVFGERAEAGAAAAAAAAAEAAAGDRLIGERNENSVLFSLSALTATETAAKTSSQKNEAVLDLRPNKPTKNNGRGGLDDIMNLGGGGGIGSPLLAPPPLLAPVVEAPPPPPVMAPTAPVGVSPVIPDMPQKKSPLGLIMGVVAVIAVMGGVAFFVMQKPAEAPTSTTEQAAAPPTGGAAASAAPTTAAAAPIETAPAAPAPAESVAAGAAVPPVGGPVVGGPLPGGPKPAKSADEKEPDKPAPAPPPEKTAEPAPAGGGSKEFNRGAATSALGGAAGAAKSCKKPDGPTGGGKVKVTFAPSGNVTSAQVQGAPFAGTPVGGCVAGVFRGARVPPFDGAPVTVTKSFTIN